MLWLWCALALAEEPEFVGTEDAGQEFEEPETDLSLEAGGSVTTGNTVFYTLSGGISAGQRWRRNKIAGSAAALSGHAVADQDGDGKLSEEERDKGTTQNAGRYALELRYDRFLGDRDSLYVLTGALRDTFGGYDLRSHEQLGYSRILVDGEATRLVTEIGFDYAQEDYVSGVDPNNRKIAAGRLMASLKHAFSDDVSFKNTVEVYENVLDPVDLRVLNEAGFTSKLSEVLSLKLSHKLVFDNQPVEGFRPLDQTGMATLVASIF